MKTTNIPNNTVNVIATTMLQSNSGRAYPYALQLEVNPANHGTHLALEYRDKRYRLDHEVGASWVSNPALLTLVRTLVRLEEVNPILYEVRDDRDYNWSLNIDNLYPWEVWIQ